MLPRVSMNGCAQSTRTAPKGAPKVFCKGLPPSPSSMLPARSARPPPSGQPPCWLPGKAGRRKKIAEDFKRTQRRHQGRRAFKEGAGRGREGTGFVETTRLETLALRQTAALDSVLR